MTSRSPLTQLPSQRNMLFPPSFSLRILFLCFHFIPPAGLEADSRGLAANLSICTNVQNIPLHRFHSPRYYNTGWRRRDDIGLVGRKDGRETFRSAPQSIQDSPVSSSNPDPVQIFQLSAYYLFIFLFQIFHLLYVPVAGHLLSHLANH